MICTDGSFIVGLRGVSIIMRVQLQFPAMNNEAKYEAVLASLRIAKALGIKNLKLRTNSKLIVGKITNEYEEKEERMKRYLKLTTQLIDEFDVVKLEQILWENNSATDEVAKLASIEDALATKELLMEVQTVPSIDGLQTFSTQQPRTWMYPILSYINDGQLPFDPSTAKKLRLRAARFIFVNVELYKRGFSLPYLKCLTPKEATYVLREIHEGICGNNSGPRSLVGKTVQVGYFGQLCKKTQLNSSKNAISVNGLEMCSTFLENY
ncbi:uncharacterized protein LOC142605899 [Castanea sativa]|uniref:uncharacterized protein LOC142605899 n=1 Tax=Castanea sativa TaxID=21020 RepID=UPI003F653346